MKIIHIVRQYWPSTGGLEEFVARLCAQQLSGGMQAEVLTLNRQFTDPSHVLPALDCHDGVAVTRIPYCGSPRYPFAPAVVSQLRSADIVHVHAIDFFFDFLAATRILHRRPLVATTHGGFFHTQAYSTLKKIWFKSITKYSARQYQAIVACSSSDRTIFSEVSPKNLHLIENGVDIDKFENAASPRPQKRMITIGRFSSNKRLDRLLDALCALTELDPGWHLDIVGFPSDWSTQRLEQEIGRRHLVDFVNVHCAADNDRIRELIRQSSLFVSASEYEGFGLALIEALSAGLLPVVHQNSAFRDFAAAYGSIVLADFADPVASSTQILRAFSRLRENVDVGRKDRLTVARKFSWATVAAQYSNLYRDAMEQGNRTGGQWQVPQ